MQGVTRARLHARSQCATVSSSQGTARKSRPSNKGAVPVIGNRRPCHHQRGLAIKSISALTYGTLNSTLSRAVRKNQKTFLKHLDEHRVNMERLHKYFERCSGHCWNESSLIASCCLRFPIRGRRRADPLTRSLQGDLRAATLSASV